MNVTAISAKFTLPTEEAIRLKFDNRLDDIVKQNLVRKLAFEILESGVLDVQRIENKYGNYETVFEGTLSCLNRTKPLTNN